MMINKKLMAQWITALRSGYFKQGKGELLNSVGNYCCLGVLRHVIEGGSSRMREEGSTITSLLPYAAIREIGLCDYETEQLAMLNDGGRPYTSSERMDFNAIALVLEDRYLEDKPVEALCFPSELEMPVNRRMTPPTEWDKDNAGYV